MFGVAVMLEGRERLAILWKSVVVNKQPTLMSMVSD